MLGTNNTELDSSAVIDWNGRPRRARKPPPKTYWEEYVATDPWYVRELLADVPAEEYQAAVEDEDWEHGEGEEDGDEPESDGEADGEDGDSDYSEEDSVVSDEPSDSEQGSGDCMDVDSTADSDDVACSAPSTPRTCYGTSTAATL